MLPTSPSPEGFSSSFSSQNQSPPRQLEASKWLDFLFLVSENELARLFEKLGPVLMYRSKGLFKQGAAAQSVQQLLTIYRDYLQGLEKGDETDLDPFYFYLSTVEEAVYHRHFDDGREKVYPVLPCLVVQPGKIVFSAVDISFRTTAFTEDPILWGIKFSFPQIFLDPTTRGLLRADRPPSPNSPLLKELRQWIRDETFPVAFEVGGNKYQTEFRLGNEMKNITLAGLQKRGISVFRA